MRKLRSLLASLAMHWSSTYGPRDNGTGGGGAEESVDARRIAGSLHKTNGTKDGIDLLIPKTRCHKTGELACMNT